MLGLEVGGGTGVGREMYPKVGPVPDVANVAWGFAPREAPVVPEPSRTHGPPAPTALPVFSTTPPPPSATLNPVFLS